MSSEWEIHNLKRLLREEFWLNEKEVKIVIDTIFDLKNKKLLGKGVE